VNVFSQTNRGVSTPPPAAGAGERAVRNERNREPQRLVGRACRGGRRASDEPPALPRLCRTLREVKKGAPEQRERGAPFFRVCFSFWFPSLGLHPAARRVDALVSAGRRRCGVNAARGAAVGLFIKVRTVSAALRGAVSS
jgi:hypothetical protein